MTMYLNPPPSADAKWRENLKRDADKLAAELKGLSRRGFLSRMGAGAIAAAVTEYVDLRRTHAMFVRGGGTTTSVTVTKITNARTGTTYQYIPDAIYQAATADTILIPAGLYAPDYPSIPYSNWQMLDSRARGIALGLPFPGSPSGFGNMYIGVNDSARFSDADYLTLQGSGTANNGRPSISRPYALLTADYTNGDGVIHLDDLSQWPDTSHSTQAWIWGDGSDISLANMVNVQVNYTGISGNDLTGVTCSVNLPTGQMLIQGPANGSALFLSISPNPGNTFNNMEVWGCPGGSGLGIRGGFALPGGSTCASFTINNGYIHHNAIGVGLQNQPKGNDAFMHLFSTELYENGYHPASSEVHNAYVGEIEEVIFDNSYSHHVLGAHLFKTRAGTNYFTYSRISGERTDANSSSTESCNIDVCNGGIAYVIGCAFEQSLNAANNVFNFGAESDYAPNNSGGGSNPVNEIYFINNTCVAPANGVGLFSGTAYAPVKVNQSAIGVGRPEQSRLSSSVAEALDARSYVVQTTMTASGAETEASTVIAGNGDNQIINWLPIAANSVIVAASPEARTGATGWNLYANYRDPVIYHTFGALVQAGNWFFWDSGHTLPIFSQAAGGSNPQTYLYWAFTYQFATGESAMLGVLGTYDGIAFSGPTYARGDYVAQSSEFWSGAGYEVNASNVVTVASPPAMTGATGWNVYCSPTPFNSGNFIIFGIAQAYHNSGGPVNGFNNNTINGLSKQNASPISIGTDWTEPTTGFIRRETTQPYMLRQNSSPLTVGATWTEPTGGLVDNTPAHLTWYRRWSTETFSNDEWYAIAPSNLTSYTIRIYIRQIAFFSAVLTPISGAVTPYPFSVDLNDPKFVDGNSGTLPGAATITFSEPAAVVFANYRSGGQPTAGSGWTSVYASNLALAQYKIFSSAQTGVSIAATGNGANDSLIADAIVQDTTLVVGTSVSGHTETDTFLDLTFSCSAGDVLLLQTSGGFLASVMAIDAYPPPTIGNIIAGSPTGLVQNNALANFYPVPTGGVVMTNTPPTNILAGGYLTLANNYQFNTWSGSGSTFDAPLWATVINDATQANYDYRLKAASGAINYGADPGTTPIDLRPHYELKLFGTPTPGTPLPTKVARPNTAGMYDAGAFEFGV